MPNFLRKLLKKRSQAYLVDENDNYYPLHLPFPTKLGRSSEADIKITGDLHVSRDHAVIIYKEEENRFFIRDLGSKHGTFINGNRLEKGEEREIRDGDHIRLGKNTRFTFRILY